jgi:hypothetical protein
MLVRELLCAFLAASHRQLIVLIVKNINLIIDRLRPMKVEMQNWHGWRKKVGLSITGIYS